MPQNCPDCGAILGHLFAEDVMGYPSAGNFDSSKAHLERIKSFMCAPIRGVDSRTTQPTMRPVVSDRDVVGLLKDSYALKTLEQVANKMQATIHAAGERSVDPLIETRCSGRGRYDSRCSPERVFEAIGAIIYAMEWTGGAHEVGVDKAVMAARASTVPEILQAPMNTHTLPRLLELMLSIDYGFQPFPIHKSLLALDTFCGFLVAVAWRWRHRQALPNSKQWDQISFAMVVWTIVSDEEVSVWDTATMLYYYQTYNKPVAAEDSKQGWKGYTGVLQEMIAEVPLRGKDRLERKLSLDAHLLIPKFVRDWKLQAQMILIIQDLAAQHGCQLASPRMPKPPLWRRWFNQARHRLSDAEKDEEREKLLDQR